MFFNEQRFVLVFDKTQAFEGTLVPKGRKGTKFDLVFDAASADAFAQFVADQMALFAGRAAETAVGQSSKLVFVLRDDQTARLRIKSSVVEADGDEIVFKSKAAGPVAPLAEG